MKFPFTYLVILLVTLLQNNVGLSQDEVATFSEITGNVVDSSGQPLESFKVTIKVYDYSEGWGKSPETTTEWEGEFTDGKFQFDVDEPITVKDNVYLSRTVTAEGYISTDRNTFRQVRNFNGKYGKLKMYRGITVTGKVVMPDSQSDESLVGPQVAVVKKMKGMMPDYNNMFRRYATLNEDGSFNVIVPEDCNLIIVARSDNAATCKKDIKIKKYSEVEGKQDVGDIKLEEGVRVSGTVVSKDGEPVKGQVVKISQTAASTGYMTEVVDGYAVTDEEGKFSLPPRIGKSKLTLAEAGRIEGKQVKVSGKKLTIKPIELNLVKGRSSENIEVREANTWTIHGFVDDEQIAENVETTVYASVPGDSQKKLELDGNGRFEFEMADGVECYLMIYNSSGSGSYMAQMSPDSIRDNRQYFMRSPAGASQFFHLKKVSCDIGPLEFEMVENLPDERTVTESILEWLIYGD